MKLEKKATAHYTMTDLRSVHSSRERRQIRNLAEAFVKVSVLGASQEAFEGAACWQRWVLVWQSASGCGSGKGPRHSLPECCASECGRLDHSHSISASSPDTARIKSTVRF